jgi:hypothetical protein
LRAHRLGQLYGEGADTASGADDEDATTRLDPAAVADRDNCGHPRDGHCGGLLEGQVARLPREPRRTRTSALREGTLDRPVDVVAGLELRHALADTLDRSGDVPAADLDLGGAKAEAHHTHQVGTAGHQVPGSGVDTRGPHPDQHFIVTGDRHFDVANGEDVRLAVLS